ncbi:putative adenylate kinase [Leishmania major strain Friedlin]|uniref:Putative adenylate kinase n=1 Tax=Leishmania major TaxID=5664 RepID=Q4Q9J9_LEIMA|nr:putative adenylate kinase [Leishmania major strain Friedlin]CAG9575262.1 adenylate_kinase_-_putative [Leishmania major strain Friedlin]CAJ05630.1 putative adenylate kinase [Leishmania major strain Friedlin]|eukprot:XP_001683999.1 putative adenylate kinase [Leishmania major strain Friedlin]
MPSKFLRLLFVGAPGVGKGTYSGLAAVSLACHAVSSGDLLRKEVAEGTAIGKQVKGLIEKGVFVPDEIITKMVVQLIASLSADKERPNGYILDGYPRNISQATALWTSGDIKIDHVINLTQPRNVIIKKLSSRRSCPDCGFVYNLASIDEGGIKMDPLKPKLDGLCDKCGCTKPLITRKDDDIDVVRKRQDEYDATATPLLRFYKEKGILHEFPVLGSTKRYLPKLLELISTLD